MFSNSKIDSLNASSAYLIDAEDESVTVFQPNQLPQVKEKQDILSVLKVLSDWQLTVENIFNWLNFV